MVAKPKPRRCYWVSEDQTWNPHFKERGYCPSMVTEGEPGHKPLGNITRSFGRTLVEARERAALENLTHFGLRELEVAQIVWEAIARQECIDAEKDLAREGLKVVQQLQAQDEDPRYQFVKCAECGHEYQRIDYHGYPHKLTCSVPDITTAAGCPNAKSQPVPGPGEVCPVGSEAPAPGPVVSPASGQEGQPPVCPSTEGA